MKHLLLLLTLCCALLFSCHSTPDNNAEPALADVPAFSADSAFSYIVAQCDLGPRVPGSDAHLACSDYIYNRFLSFGLWPAKQRVRVRRYDGAEFECYNIAAVDTTAPSDRPRLLLAAHWDTRPWADNDPDPANHHLPLLGANDGASGVALLLEVARTLSVYRGEAAPHYAVDFLCFDAEDSGLPEWDTDYRGNSTPTWCLGSQAWASDPHSTDYQAAILLDMVGGHGSRFYKEGFSMRYAPELCERVWAAAARAGYSAFFPTGTSGYVTDDHVPVNSQTPLRMIDIVPYYEGGNNSFAPTWHTLQDTPQNIDPLTLRAVGQTLLEFIFNN